MSQSENGSAADQKYPSLSVDLNITVQEVRMLPPGGHTSVFNISPLDVIGKDTFSTQDNMGRIAVTLTCGSELSIDSLAERLVEEARTAVGEKKVLLDSLGKFGEFLAVILALSDAVTNIIHLYVGAKGAAILASALFERCKAQQQCREEAAKLMGDLSSFLPFTGDGFPGLMENERTKRVVKEMLELFCDVSKLIIKYSSKGILGDLIFSRRDDIGKATDAFKKLKDTFDWYIKAEQWRLAISTEKRAEMFLLQQLHPARRAYYDDSEGNMCLEGTRKSVLEQIEDWAVSDLELFWLHGVAGSGKSAIASSVAHMFEQRQLLLFGCFFCKRDDPECHNPMNLLPTLAYHFSKWYPAYCSLVLSVLRGADEPKLSQNVHWQFELLMKRPLTYLNANMADLPPRPLIVVIDALDECGDTCNSRLSLARHLAEVANTVPWLKIFITSRPLPEFKQIFLQDMVKAHSLDINKEIGSEQVHEDILLYTKHCAERFSLTGDQIISLASKASGLFIWISTAFKYISAQLDENEAVESLLSQSPADNPEAELDKVYTTVLQSASGGYNNTQIVKAVIGIVVCTSKNKPLPEASLLEFLTAIIGSVNMSVIKKSIDNLQAVLYRDASKDGAVCVCHPSFLDFANTQTHSQDYWTNPASMDMIMSARCLKVMDSMLKFNICGLETSYLLNEDVPGLQGKINSHIPQHLQYSCLYWMNHLVSYNGIDADTIHGLLGQVFCGPKSLYWLECLSLIEELKSGIDILELFTKHYKPTRILGVASGELYRLLIANYVPISVSTPHLYVSALSWVPIESYIAKAYYLNFQNQPLISAGKEKNWNPMLWTANANSNVNCVTYSPDGRYIASGLGDGTLRIWDAQTGSHVGEPLTGHSKGVWSVAYSPDGRHIVSGSDDDTLRIWDSQTGGPVGEPLTGHSKVVKSVAYSPDGRHIVSGSWDGTLRIWDAQTGYPVGEPLTGHSSWVNSVAYSPDGKHIVSGSSDNTLRIWDPQTGNPVGKPLIGHSDWVMSVAYSPCGRHIVSGSNDGTLRIWYADTVQAGFEVGGSHSPNTVGDDGWVRDPSGNLLLWVPYMYRVGIHDVSKICIPEFVNGESVRVDWGRLMEFTGSSWINILK
ncbi:hypothetical protein M0805_003159 [Coniferiporia weirii]|nr:hypothetical protein M0805_003159 [Coniferiporia weirii]